MKYLVSWAAISVSLAVAYGQPDPVKSLSLQRAEMVLDSIYSLYSTGDASLLRENYPHDSQYRADYLADGQTALSNRYAYLWPFSGTLSAAVALLAHTNDKQYITLIDERILPALQEYYDDSRKPAAYASYIRSAGLSDRFYDDNIWLGIDFAELFLHTGRKQYLEKAKEIWSFVISGQDSLLEGGIYWCEQKKTSKNTCSNAPAAVLAFRMFEATNDSAYFYRGKELYEWTKRHLQDPEDGLYWDNINLQRKIDKRKYPYNSGQMLQSATMLFRLTGDSLYLSEARRIAEAGLGYFFADLTTEDGQSMRLLKRSDNWFIAVMMRGYAALYDIDGDRRYLDAFQRSLDYAWMQGRDAHGLFGKDWKTRPRENTRKWLLDQAAMVEMYARLIDY
ncbi:glycoside hydrolase family 76 protein [Parapedobacter deserti]|uniref:Glycoside hydrolase family 76 protein n=1 Tax=Parapedobacter deserti TaxID=1912957 RepID=A0ABV7JSY8_9SPHI